VGDILDWVDGIIVDDMVGWHSDLDLSRAAYLEDKATNRVLWVCEKGRKAEAAAQED
jgi:hypothetical protein